MKNSEILELSNEDLVERIKQEKANLHKLKFAHAVSAIENPLRIRAARKLVARLSTELSARRNAEAKKKQETAAEAQ
ncbi:50S ribosomal protein L29 [Olivibacter sitiensis]|uniref:50S ribosomal protein L29 n=1 Tax=Olivibacter sitiensis TaxID=376470 RepID=UPI0004184D2E|nr:50S ribosomal protein L29 [Olivibacter sitiensis]